MRDTITFVPSQMEMAKEFHNHLPPLLAQLVTTEEIATEALMTEVVELSTIVQDHLSDNATAVVKPFDDSYIIEGASIEIANALQEKGFEVRLAGDIILAKRRAKPRRKHKASSTTKPYTKKPDPNANLKRVLNHLGDPASHRLAQAMWKKTIGAADFSHFTTFAHDLDDLVESYRVKCGHEPCTTTDDEDNPDFYPGGDMLVSKEGEQILPELDGENAEKVAVAVANSTNFNLLTTPMDAGNLSIVIAQKQPVVAAVHTHAVNVPAKPLAS